MVGSILGIKLVGSHDKEGSDVGVGVVGAAVGTSATE
jgi:hypothetical protein